MNLRLLRRYIWSAVLWSTLLVLLVVMGLDGVFSFVDELGALYGNYHAFQAFMFVLETLPRRFNDYLPLAILLGTLLGMGLLANSGELTVIRAAGVSVARIAWMVLRPVIFLLIIGLIVNEYVSPYTEQLAQSSRAIAREGGGLLYSRYGFWQREGNDFIHINAVEPNGVLHGVTRYRFKPDWTLAESQFARRAIYQGDHWFLEDIKGTRFLPDQTESYTESSDTWKTHLTPQLLSILIMDPDHLAAHKLYTYAHYLRKQGLASNEYMLAFWQRVMQPLATVGMVLIALSFIFGSLRSVSMGLRLMSGVMVGMLFYYGQQFFGHLGLILHTAPALAAGIPVLVCLLAGMVMVRRVH